MNEMRKDPATEFQFPSNGKAYSKQYSIDVHGYNGNGVSIPFKREGIFQVKPMCSMKFNIVFQFPSNGKAYSKEKWEQWVDMVYANVSIPFKREGIFQA